MQLRLDKYYFKTIPVLLLTMLVLARGQDIYLPVKAQLQIFFKILSFDRKLEERAGRDLVLGIVYQARFISSYNTKNEFMEEINQTRFSVNDYKIKYITIDLEVEDLEKAIVDNNIDILYITPLRAFDLQKIFQISRKCHILTLSGVPDYVESGVTAGVTVKDNKPQILINLSSARQENIDFSSQLLKLARIYE